jgi:hypothetical protein
MQDLEKFFEINVKTDFFSSVLYLLYIIELQIKMNYIDSRDMNQSSDSHSDFKYLPYSVNFPEDTVAYIDEICLHVSWYTVDENRNNKLYFSDWIIIPCCHC